MDSGEREGVDELIREARAEARAAVKLRLRERFERDLESAVHERLRPRPPQPPPKERGEGLWVYCITAADHPGVAEALPGVAAGRPPRAVRAGRLAALVSAVPLDEFGEEGLRRNLNDFEWLEATARAHEAVDEAALASGPLVPMRVCTIYRSEAHVRELLERRRDAFAEALEWLAGRAEWGVKVLLRRERFNETLREPGGDGAAADGEAYLARKQSERRLRAQADALVEEAVRECHARLEEWATTSQLLPPQRPELAGYAGEMVMNGAYLVDDDRADAFARVVDELGEQHATRGLSYQLTGPWPAYHFVAGLESSQEALQ